MATRVIKICDRCYKEYSPFEIEQVPLKGTKLLPIQNVRFGISYGFNGCDSAYLPMKKYDLCPQCAKQLLTWFYNKDKNDVTEK